MRETDRDREGGRGTGEAQVILQKGLSGAFVQKGIGHMTVERIWECKSYSILYYQLMNSSY